MNIHHKTKYILLYSLFLLIISQLVSCKKTDFKNSQLVIDRERFFNLPENSPAILHRIISNMKTQDAQKPFVDDFVKNQGYPIWEHAKICVSKNNYNTIEPGGDTLVSVPIVENGRQYLKSVLAIKVNTDVWYKLLEGIKYRELSNQEQGTTGPSFTAGEFLKLMMEMESKIFGQTNFKIIDTGIVINSTSTGSGISIPNYGIQIQFANGCTVFNYGFYNEGSFTIQSSETVCIYETGVLNYTLTAPETGSSGGGGGGSGTGSNSNEEECERGFIGIIGFGTGGIPIIPCPLLTNPTDSSVRDSIIKKKLHDDQIAVKNIRDSLWNAGHSGKIEYFFYGYVNPNGVIDTIGVKTDSSENDVLPNYRQLKILHITPIFDWHCHSDQLSKDRHPHDPDDIAASNSYYSSIQDFRSYVDCGDTLYAIVNEDLNKIRTFLQTKNLDIQTNLWSNPMYYSPNRRQLGMNKLLELLGSSNISGLGLYKSINSDKTEFIKLN